MSTGLKTKCTAKAKLQTYRLCDEVGVHSVWVRRRRTWRGDICFGNADADCSCPSLVTISSPPSPRFSGLDVLPPRRHVQARGRRDGGTGQQGQDCCAEGRVRESRMSFYYPCLLPFGSQEDRRHRPLPVRLLHPNTQRTMTLRVSPFPPRLHGPGRPCSPVQARSSLLVEQSFFCIIHRYPYSSPKCIPIHPSTTHRIPV